VSFKQAGMEGAVAIAKTSPQLVSGEIAIYQIMADNVEGTGLTG